MILAIPCIRCVSASPITTPVRTITYSNMPMTSPPPGRSAYSYSHWRPNSRRPRCLPAGSDGLGRGPPRAQVDDRRQVPIGWRSNFRIPFRRGCGTLLSDRRFIERRRAHRGTTPRGLAVPEAPVGDVVAVSTEPEPARQVLLVEDEILIRISS